MAFISLKTKMTVAGSLLAALLLSTLAFSAQSYFVGQLKKLISNQQFTLLGALADQVDDKLNSTKTEVGAAASTLNRSVIDDPARIRKFFAERLDTLAMFDNGLFLFSPQGTLIYANPPEPDLVGRRFSGGECFQKALSSRRPLISEPFISSQWHKHPIILISAPVFDDNGALIAVLAGSLDLTRNNFLTNLASIKLGKDGYLYLFNQSRIMIVHHDPRRIFAQDVAPGANQLYEQALAGFEGTGSTINSRRVPVISAFKRLKSTGWILASNFPEADAYAPIYGAQRYILLVLLTVFSLCILVFWLTMKHLTSPLLTFTDQIRELIAHNTGRSRVSIKTGDEIGVLADAFNQLLEEVEGQKAELKKQLELSQILIDCIPVPVFYKDLAGRYLGCNKAFEEVTGLSKQQLFGKTVFDVAPSHLASLYRNSDQELAQAKESHIFQSEAVYADGRRRDVIFFKTVYPNSDGSRGGIVAAMLDITEQKLAQDAHEQTRRKLQLILDAAGEGIYGIDMSGKITFANPAALQMVGWQQDELLGVHHSLLHHAKGMVPDCSVVGCPMYQALTKGLTCEVISQDFYRKDGTTFPVEFISTPILENGTLVGAVGIFKDTTDRKRTEEQLTRLSQAVMQSPVPIVITDTAGMVEFINPAFSKMSGYQADEIIGASTSRLRSGKTRVEVYQSLWSTISTGSVWAGDLQNRHKNGDLYWVHCTISPIRDSSGNISQYMSSMESMTERKQLEEQLRQAQKMEAIGQLAGGVAHDFNNILTVIMGFGQLLQHSMGDDAANGSNLKQILDAANRASHLTSSLLAFSRKQVMLLELVELNELTRNHTRFLARIIGEDVALETELDGEPLPVMADGGQIEQVLMNLAANARDAMPNGGTLRIKTSSVHLNQEFCRHHGYGAVGRYALLTISDNGSGMDAETREKIFEPFFTTKPSGRGTGLGLSIVYGIIKQHGGYVTIDSRCGVGTTFDIYLPLTAYQAGEGGAPLTAVAPSGGKETILVVEDDAMVRNMVDSLLQSFGYRVLSAENGEEALALFDAHGQDIALALLDVVMPGMNGRQVCEALRARSPHLKVLFLTGYTADVIKDRGILVDGIELMLKPAQSDVLVKKIRSMLDSRYDTSGRQERAKSH